MARHHTSDPGTLQPSPAPVIWITGLSGAGKSSLSAIVAELARESGIATVLLDGDTVRAINGDELAHDVASRLQNAYRISRWCKELSEQGLLVVCSTMSLYPEIWEWNRANLRKYCEVYLQVPMDVLIERDAKGLYQRAVAGVQGDVVGIHQRFDEPTAPHLIIHNSNCSREEQRERARRILRTIQGPFPLPSVAASKKCRLGTKAETLVALRRVLTCSSVKPLVPFSVKEWNTDRESVLETLATMFPSQTVIVRSSCAFEDTGECSNAGAYRSVPNMDARSRADLGRAIDSVIESYGPESAAHQVFVQEQVCDIEMCGVLLTRDLDTLAPYFICNYEMGGAHDGVTSGTSTNQATWIRSRFATGVPENPHFAALVAAAEEIMQHTSGDALDIEFAFDRSHTLWILQVRAIVSLRKTQAASDEEVKAQLFKMERKILKLDGTHPQLAGNRAMFSVMTDWNPAEIVGIKPRMLALSLYKNIITDAIWAYQRDNYGYRNLRGFPLLISFMGHPYIDVRASLNSFIPASLSDQLAGKLVNYYLDRLANSPSDHDKVEFNIVFSCYVLGLPKHLLSLHDGGFSELEIDRIKFALLKLTNRIIDPVHGHYLIDLKKIEHLGPRYDAVLASELSLVDKIYWLLEDCKRFGTLPFAGLARAGFIAVQLLRSLVHEGIFTDSDFASFMASLNTVSRQLASDIQAFTSGRATRDELLQKYGHLRPGTYDILSKRYDEAFELYFDPTRQPQDSHRAEFRLGKEKAKRLEEALCANGLEVSAEQCLAFIRTAIEAREHSKYLFTRSLSQALRLIEQLGARLNISRDDLSHLNVGVLLDAYSRLEPTSLEDLMRSNIAENRRAFGVTNALKLPQLITGSKGIYEFSLGGVEPNFITKQKVTEIVVLEEALPGADLAGKVVFIRSADPGYDWLFSRRIGGLVTMYGGANSHMAIRCSELQIPAVVGCGEENFRHWAGAAVVEIDCSNRKVRIVR